MSIEAVNAVMLGMRDVEPTEKLVALILADCSRSDSNACAFPAVATVAQRACISESQARRILHGLVVKGWTSTVRASRGGRNVATVYQLNMARLLASNPRTDARVKTPDAAVAPAVTLPPAPGFPVDKPVETLAPTQGLSVDKSGTDSALPLHPCASTLASEAHNPSTHDTLAFEPVLTGDLRARAGARVSASARGPTHFSKILKPDPEHPPQAGESRHLTRQEQIEAARKRVKS